MMLHVSEVVNLNWGFRADVFMCLVLSETVGQKSRPKTVYSNYEYVGGKRSSISFPLSLIRIVNTSIDVLVKKL